MLENFSNPKENLQKLKIKPGSIVVDMGSGSGHYTFAASEILGDSGRVYAVDIQKDMLARVQSEANERNLKNVEIIWGDVENVGGTKLRSNSVDYLIVANILFMVDSKPGLVHESYRILKDGGQVLVIDWSESFGGLGPQPNRVVSESDVKNIFEEGGFVLIESVKAGAHHYGFIFQKIKN